MGCGAGGGAGDYLDWPMGNLLGKENDLIWNALEQSSVLGMLPRQTKNDRKCQVSHWST